MREGPFFGPWNRQPNTLYHPTSVFFFFTSIGRLYPSHNMNQCLSLCYFSILFTLFLLNEEIRHKMYKCPGAHNPHKIYTTIDPIGMNLLLLGRRPYLDPLAFVIHPDPTGQGPFLESRQMERVPNQTCRTFRPSRFRCPWQSLAALNCHQHLSKKRDCQQNK